MIRGCSGLMTSSGGLHPAGAADKALGRDNNVNNTTTKMLNFSLKREFRIGILLDLSWTFWLD